MVSIGQCLRVYGKLEVGCVTLSCPEVSYYLLLCLTLLGRLVQGAGAALDCKSIKSSLSLSLSKMAHIFSCASIPPGLTAQHQHHLSFPPNPPHNGYRFRCRAESRTTNSPTDKESQPQNALLKVAWYSSELLGIATSFFRPPSTSEPPPDPALELARDGSGAVDRAVVVKSIKEDFERSYFVTGNLRLDAYEEDCEFADPASSFRGLQRFKRNCTNFGSLLVKSNMKLMKWEDFEDKGIGHWRFGCILTFPWRPILSASGYTEYYFDAVSGKVCRHVEHWNVPKMVLLKQILKPSRRFWPKKSGG